MWSYTLLSFTEPFAIWLNKCLPKLRRVWECYRWNPFYGVQMSFSIKAMEIFRLRKGLFSLNPFNGDYRCIIMSNLSSIYLPLSHSITLGILPCGYISAWCLMGIQMATPPFACIVPCEVNGQSQRMNVCFNTNSELLIMWTPACCNFLLLFSFCWRKLGAD